MRPCCGPNQCAVAERAVEQAAGPGEAVQMAWPVPVAGSHTQMDQGWPARCGVKSTSPWPAGIRTKASLLPSGDHSGAMSESKPGAIQVMRSAARFRTTHRPVAAPVRCLPIPHHQVRAVEGGMPPFARTQSGETRGPEPVRRLAGNPRTADPAQIGFELFEIRDGDPLGLERPRAGGKITINGRAPKLSKVGRLDGRP